MERKAEFRENMLTLSHVLADVGLVRSSRLQVLVAVVGCAGCNGKGSRRGYKGVPGSVEGGLLHRSM